MPCLAISARPASIHLSALGSIGRLLVDTLPYRYQSREDAMQTGATYRGTVYPWQCDHMGHMNIMWYVGKFDEANWNLFARIGLTSGYLRDSGRGMAGVQQNISYQRELFAG